MYFSDIHYTYNKGKHVFLVGLIFLPGSQYRRLKSFAIIINLVTNDEPNFSTKKKEKKNFEAMLSHSSIEGLQQQIHLQTREH
jgi:hypothetical protein